MITQNQLPDTIKILPLGVWEFTNLYLSLC